MIYDNKRIKRKISKGKVHGGKLEKPGTSFQVPLPVESHSTCLTPLAMVVTILGRLIRDLVPRVFIGRVILETPSAWHARKFHSPRRKAGTWHKPYCLFQQFRCREPLLSKIEVPRCQPRASLISRPF